MIDSPTRDRLTAACQEYEAAAAKPSLNKLAVAHGVHNQVLTGALLAWGLIGEPVRRGPRPAKMQAGFEVER